MFINEHSYHLITELNVQGVLKLRMYTGKQKDE